MKGFDLTKILIPSVDRYLYIHFEYTNNVELIFTIENPFDPTEGVLNYLKDKFNNRTIEHIATTFTKVRYEYHYRPTLEWKVCVMIKSEEQFNTTLNIDELTNTIIDTTSIKFTAIGVGEIRFE